MCGIAGIVGNRGNPDQLSIRLTALEGQIRHRGPDSEGRYIAKESECGFVHTRLAILGLSPSGRQPMVSADGRYWITFNGEIYNFRSLRSELERNGHRFSTETDTEVLIQLYHAEGSKCLERLEGMFSFVIWDTVERCAFAARDPFGIKPFYYRLSTEGELTFASELQAILADGAAPRRLNHRAVLGYLLTGSVQEPDTLIDGIQCLAAGHFLTWKAGSISVERYWNISFPNQEISWGDAVSQTTIALEESVQRHFVSDVPVGVFLSGGLDSSALVALASRIGIRDLRTFCIRFDEASFDESEVALQTARHFGYTFETWRLNAQSAQPVLGEYLSAMDQPSIDGFNTFCVARHARSVGMKVVLSGLGGDELFGGYGSFRRIPQLMRMLQLFNRFGAQGIASRFLANQTGPVRRVAAALQAPPNWGIAHWAMRGIFTPSEALRLAQSYAQKSTVLPTAEDLLLAQCADDQSDLIAGKDWVCKLEFERYLRNQLLRDSDVFSMAWGMELRVPFVDRRLFDTLSAIPARHRLASKKRLLQAAVPELPAWVTGRRKQGFVIPFAKWAMGEWNAQLGASETRVSVPLSTWYQRWALFALDQFIQRHGIQVER